jgi:hypothetical protein
MCVFSLILVEMARKHSKSGKKRTLKQRQRKYKGGGWGFTGPSSIPGTPGTVSNPQVFTGIGDCRAVQPGYNIPYSQYGASFKGLPGMSGGKRTRKGSKGKKTRKQRGGRYGFFPEGAAGVTPNGAAWWAGTYPPVQRIGCEGGAPNPLNPTHTGSSAPPGAANPNYYLKGGAQQVAPATYGVGNVDSMYYYAPTGGYANTASTWKDSVGAPVQIQVPYAARAMNQACLTTGGHAPLTGALQTGGKRTRKNRRGGAYPIPGLGAVPTSFDNLRQLYSNATSRLSGFFGLGAPAPAVMNQPTPPAEEVVMPPAEPAANGIANGRSNNNKNANRRNRNNNNANGRRNNNTGMNGNFNFSEPTPAPTTAPEPAVEFGAEPAPAPAPPAMTLETNGMAPPSPELTASPTPAGINAPVNGMAPPMSPNTTVNTSTPPMSPNATANTPSLPMGGRGKRKSRRSKRSALQKKKV